jgi:hypothetical protein
MGVSLRATKRGIGGRNKLARFSGLSSASF